MRKMLAALLLLLPLIAAAQGPDQIVIQISGQPDVIIKLTPAALAAFSVYGWTPAVAFQNFLDSIVVNAAAKRREESLQKITQIKDTVVRDQILNDAATKIEAQIEAEKPK